jgi:hypothetical protein
MKYCIDAVLVGVDQSLPLDPSVAFSGKPPMVGCNHVVCINCEVDVRHADKCSQTSNNTPMAASLLELYESSDAAGSDLLKRGRVYDESRTYFCRCDWRTVHGGTLLLSYAEQPWKCGGHPEPTEAEVTAATEAVQQAARVAAAQQEVADYMEKTAAVIIPTEGAKIELSYGIYSYGFSTVSELRDALLASYPDAAVFGKPIIGWHRDESAPAWGWVNDLILMRSDWWPSIGIALQHATTNGGEFARIALAELCGHYKQSIALLPWTAPLAALWPDRRAVTSAATGMGRPDFRLDAIIRDHRKLVEGMASDRGTTSLIKYGEGGDYIVNAQFRNEKDLKALLEKCAKAGQFPDGDGPWSWLFNEFMYWPDWTRPAFVQIVKKIDINDMTMVCALLDWFSEKQDLWQHFALLQSWLAQHPAWWDTSSDMLPPGWKKPIRNSSAGKTFGTLVVEILRRAKWQVATPPVLDLPLLYGPVP